MASIMQCVTDMRTKSIQQQQQEPIGIVIADGGRADTPTRFSAFVWGPVPEDSDLRDEVRELLAAS
ncbi:MAG: hypothetical protein IPP90_00720 [Gemmatimonadaceae bacterium]|nr:hypothetical protein [Gemmatimonadaceae bacterium]